MEHAIAQKTIRKLLGLVAAAALSLSAFGAQALKSDDTTLVEGAKLCTQYLPRHERQYGIPEHLLAAIASTESGRFHKALGLNLPWPWTINVEGTGYFFDTKQEAINAVRAFQARGISSIDVGCMQVNLHHHPNAFSTLEQAFDPAYNVAYAAQFLKDNFTQEGSWRKATADYHSRTPTFGEQYAHLVYGAWSRIINKVADARAGRPILNASASKATYTAKASSTPKTPHVYHAIHMHDISVASDTSREKGVLVIRPHYESQPRVLQEASLDNEFVVHPTRDAGQTRFSSERSAIAPDGVASVSTGDEVSHGAKIVKLSADAANAKGQFQPSAHVVHMQQDTAPSTSMFAPDPTIGNTTSSKSPFVF